MARHYQDEIDFKEMLKQPRKLFGYSYLYFLVFIVALGIYSLLMINQTGLNTIPSQVLADSARFIADIPLQAAVDQPPVDVKVAGISTPELIIKGGQIYAGNCASCHGEQGKGDGLAGIPMDPKPRNLTNPTGWKNGPKVSGIFKTLQEGIIQNGMASYSHLPAMELFAVSHFVRTFVPEAPEDLPEDLENLENTYMLSKGKKTSPQIPIRKATRLLVKDSEKAERSVRNALAGLSVQQPEVGARLFQTYGNDPQVIFTIVRAGSFTGTSDFIDRISRDPAMYGFAPSVNRLSNEEWDALYRWLARSIN